MSEFFAQTEAAAHSLAMSAHARGEVPGDTWADAWAALEALRNAGYRIVREQFHPAAEMPVSDPLSRVWMVDAKCGGTDPLVFTEAQERSGEARRAAREFCGHCPVRRECAAYADAHEYDGLWGGAVRRRHFHGRLGPVYDMCAPAGVLAVPEQEGAVS